jgi:CubicO group peptidase (beta-lactamase class C family)
MRIEQSPGLLRSTPAAEGIADAAIRHFVEELSSALGAPHSMMLLVHGKVVAEGWWKPYVPEAQHMLFSVSKSFTSTAIGLLIDEGLLSLESRVIDLLPEDLPAVVSTNLAAMTVRDLLTMTSGHATDTLEAIERSAMAGGSNWAKAILAEPIVHIPGSTFVYNSGATYLLSAILTRITGQRLIDYLTPRLFEPLGIQNPMWEQCPRGIDAGGWGLALTTEQIAAFGQLLLQGGLWQDAQIVPAAWVAEATSFQVPNGDADLRDAEGIVTDGSQGYGYQFWRCQAQGAYRADGAFGQMCIVLPEQDTVLVLTCGIESGQSALDVVWEHLVPHLPMTGTPADADSVAESAGADLAGADLALEDAAALRTALQTLELAHPVGTAFSVVAGRVSGQRYMLEANDLGLEAVTLSFGTGRVGAAALTLNFAGIDFALECGSGEWVDSQLPFLAKGIIMTSQTPAHPVALAGAWVDALTFLATIQYTETPFALTLSMRFATEGPAEGSVVVRLSQSVSFGAKALLAATGLTA